MTTVLSDQGKLIGRRLLFGTVAFVIAGVVLLLGYAFGDQGVTPGPAGDSRVTTDRGAAAVRMLMERRGATVTRSGGPLDDIERLSTVVLLEPGYFSDVLGFRLDEYRAHLDRGGMVVLGGNVNEEFISDLAGEALEAFSTGQTRFEIAEPLAGVSGHLVTEQTRAFRIDNETVWTVLAGTPAVALVVAKETSGGVLVAVADVGPFTNALIDEGANAGFVAGLLSRYDTVVFDDLAHGYRETVDGGASSWFASAPPSVRRTLLLLGCVAGLALVTYGRRFGPPEDEIRRLPPARSEHIRSVGSALGRTANLTQALEPTRRAALRLLTRRMGRTTVDSDDELRRIAADAGLDEFQTRAIIDGPRTPAEALALDGAVARLSVPMRSLQAESGSNDDGR